MTKNSPLRIIWFTILLLGIIVMSLFLHDSKDYEFMGNGLSKMESIAKFEVLKSQRLLRVYQHNENGTLRLAKTYKIALGRNAIGHKQHEGDHKTPEGKYTIVGMHPKSNYHLALEISYPDAKDKETAKKMGFSPGGKIMIHGLRNGFGWVGKHHTVKDWTLGCIAVTNEEIEEIYARTKIGTTIVIFP
jgi:murein L,D-transpeptidase YafK